MTATTKSDIKDVVAILVDASNFRQQYLFVTTSERYHLSRINVLFATIVALFLCVNFHIRGGRRSIYRLVKFDRSTNLIIHPVPGVKLIGAFSERKEKRGLKCLLSLTQAH